MSGKYTTIPQFSEAHEAFIAQGLACGMSYRDIAEKMMLFFDGFNPDQEKKIIIRITRVAHSDKMKEYILDSRETWEKECADVPIAVRKIRLQRMENEYHPIKKESIEKVIVTPSAQEIIVYKQNTPMMLKLLQAAKAEMAELNQPTQDAPQGKTEDSLKITMREDSMFKGNPDATEV